MHPKLNNWTNQKVNLWKFTQLLSSDVLSLTSHLYCTEAVLISEWIIEKDGLTALFKSPWPPLWFTLPPSFSSFFPARFVYFPYCAIISILTYSSCTSFCPILTFLSSTFCFILSSHVLLMWIPFCDRLFRREWTACLTGQPASAYHPSARRAVVLEFCWELSSCLCLFLSCFTLLTHIHTLSCFFLSLPF